MSNNFIATKVSIQIRRNLEYRNKALAKLALLGFAFGSVCEEGQTPNVPMWVGIKLSFKMCGGKIFENLLGRLECRKSQLGLCQGTVKLSVELRSSVVVVSFFTLAGNGSGLKEVAI
jgi:hypothetical protein